MSVGTFREVLSPPATLMQAMNRHPAGPGCSGASNNFCPCERVPRAIRGSLGLGASERAFAADRSVTAVPSFLSLFPILDSESERLEGDQGENG